MLPGRREKVHGVRKRASPRTDQRTERRRGTEHKDVEWYLQKDLINIRAESANDPRIITIRQMRRMWDVDNQP